MLQFCLPSGAHPCFSASLFLLVRIICQCNARRPIQQSSPAYHRDARLYQKTKFQIKSELIVQKTIRKGQRSLGLWLGLVSFSLVMRKKIKNCLVMNYFTSCEGRCFCCWLKKILSLQLLLTSLFFSSCVADSSTLSLDAVYYTFQKLKIL